MEPRFRRDFSHVRIHTNSRAADSAEAIQARAYTFGQDIVFGPGRYAPESGEGRELLAHELAHTVQQLGTWSFGNSLEISRPGDRLEQQADAAACSVAGGREATMVPTGSGSGVPGLHGSWLQRQPEPRRIGSPSRKEAADGKAKTDTGSSGGYEAVFSFQTFIPDEYVPGTGGLGYGDNRGFGKPGDSYRTFQAIVVQTDETLSESGAEGQAAARTGISKTTVPLATGHASPDPLHMSAKRKDTNSVTVDFDGSIQNGARLVGLVSPAIDFEGAITISNSGGKHRYSFNISHDAFPAYEAFVNNTAIYRWSYPSSSTVFDLFGSGTAISETRKTGDPPGGLIGARKFEGVGGGSFGGGGAGGKY